MRKFFKSLLLMALLCVPWVMQAQSDTLTVADGSESNSYVPFYGYWMDASQHNQVIYPASMIANISGDSITGIGFYMASTNSSPWNSTVTISLGITGDASLTALNTSADLVQVWQGTVNGQGNFWINFDQAFPYPGGNLLLDIQTSAGSFSGGSFYGTQVPNASFYSYNTTANSVNFVPKTSFLHVEGDFEICAMPRGLSVLPDTADLYLSWISAESPVDDYAVFLNDSLIATTGDTFYTISNLAPNTPYSVKVASVCGTDYSPAVAASVRTACSQISLPFFTSFENDPYGVFPPCWTRTIASGTDPSVNTVYAHTGTQSMYLQASYDYNLFASKAIPTDGNDIKVDFWARLSNNYEGWIQAGVMTDPTIDSTFIPLLYINDMAGEWKHYNFSTHDLDASATYYVAFKYYGTGAYNSAAGAIDDITISQTDGCAMPRLAAFDSVDTSFVTLHWVSGASNNDFELAYSLQNDVNTASVVSSISDTVYTVNDLNSNSSYHFWVRSLCSSGDTSLWYYAGSIRTTCATGMDAPVFEDFASFDYEAPSCWTVMQSYDSYGSIYPYASSYDGLSFYPQYGQPNLIAMPFIRLAANEMDIEINAQTNSYNAATLEVGYVTDLSDASTFRLLGAVTSTTPADYEFTTDTVTADTIWIAFRASTNGQYGYAYVHSVNIHHLSNCMRPDNLVLDTVSHEMAQLHCTTVTGATGYEVLYATVNNVNADGAQTESSSDGYFTINGLSPSTTYYTWVRTVCGSEEYSDWRQGPQFTTMCGEDFCLLQVDLHDSYGDGWNGNAINMYTNGTLLTSATISSGYSATAQLSMCQDDTVVLIWNTGSFASETSFEVYHAGSQVIAAAGTDFATGDTIVVRMGCPTCTAVSNLVAVDTAATDGSVTVSWTPASENDSEWIISLNGSILDVANDNTFTIDNLEPGNGYNIGVATYCGEGDTSDFVYVYASTLCDVSCNVVVEMIDSYGDGWNGNAISLYQNGGLKGTATLTSGNYQMASIPVCQGDSIEIRWTLGSYVSETSFRILSLSGDTLYSGNATAEGFVGMTDTVSCPSCSSPTNIAISNITTNSATINWNTNGSASSWLVTVNSASAMVLNTVITSVPYTITGLDAATSYTLSVSSICDNDTAAASYATVITSCDAITLPWYFDPFTDPSYNDHTLPNCWYAPQTYDSYGTLYPANTYSGLTVYGSSGSSCMVASPLIPTAGNNIYVRFHASSYMYNNPTMTAGIMTDPSNPATYIPLVNITSSESTEYEFTTDNVTGITANDSVYVAFQVVPPTDYGSGNLYIEDLYVQSMPSCHRPDSIVASNVTSSAVTLTWPATGATNYTVSYGDTSFVVSTNSVSLSNLTPGTTYTVYVQGNCASDSSLLQHLTFNTSCAAVTIPWTESFEGYSNYAAPNCWTMYNQYPDYDGNIAPYIYNDSYYAHTGVASLTLMGTSAIRSMAVGPELTGAAMNTLHVSFWVYGSSSYGFEAGFMTDPSDTSTFIPVLNVPTTTYNSTQYDFMTNSLTNAATSYHFAIRMLNSASYSGSIYIDDINIIVMPACSDEFAAVSVNGVTSDGATISWTPGLGVNANATYTVNLMDANNNSLNTYTDVTSPLTITGLGANATYKAIVSLNCGGGVSAVSDTVSFTTLCSSLDAFFSFDTNMIAETSNYAPMGYSYYNYSYTQTIIDSARMVEGDIVGFAFLPASAETGDYFTHMDVYMANVSATDFNNGWIVPDDSTVFTQVISDANMCYDTADWQQHTFNQRFVWDGHSNVLVAIRRGHGSYNTGASFSVHSDATTTAKTIYGYNDNTTYDISNPDAASSYNVYTGDYVGDFMFLVCGESCPAPTALSATAVDYQSATISWNAASDSVEYAIKAVSDATYPAPTAIINNGSFSFTGLVPATTYSFHVRTICEEEVTSNWADLTFTTDSLPCFAPSSLEVTNLEMNAATFNWTVNGEETAWRIRVWNTNFDQTYDVTSHPATVTGLTKNTQYNAAVMAVCGGILESEASDTVSFTTLDCPVPTNVAVSNVTTHTATITWNGTASSYTLEYGSEGYPQGDGTAIANITGNSYQLTDLVDGYAYDVYVMANCDAQNASDWSTKATFTTLVGINGVEGSMVTVYPNPTSNSTTITLTGVNGDVTIAIVDMNGRTVRSETMNCEGDCAKTMQVNDLAQGAYFVRINGDNVNMVKKLIVK